MPKKIVGTSRFSQECKNVEKKVVEKTKKKTKKHKII